ncbi:helix-turn-helix transcriptional regulator [uncultured Rhodospira sp.]|uniref:helix-turn-helix domain-containing protein n=1 Tax=uncultured Rhodospira sp. TaxID=1936189 RepID=UPI00262018F3|nr:helix-turn-helix transcriptional regulator [uncultured Rhodospira sp.]
MESENTPGRGIVSIVADNIRAKRESMGLSQEELADRAGYHRTYISSIERGKRNISIVTLEKISIALGVSVVVLVENE